MSFDLAVWEGERPSTDAEAAKTYQRVMDRLEVFHGDNGTVVRMTRSVTRDGEATPGAAAAAARGETR